MILETDSLPPAAALILSVVFNPGSIEVIIGVVAIFMLLTVTALFSGAETAFFSLRPADLERLKGLQTNNSQIVLRFLDHPQNLLATILVASNFINIGVVILSTWVTNSMIDFSNSPILGFLVQVVCISFFLLFFGEIVPKVFASQRPLLVVLFMVRPLLFLSKIQYPINVILIHSTSFVRKRYHYPRKNISIDEISDALDLTSPEEMGKDQEILEGIVKFGNISVNEVMCPRVDMVSVDVSSSFGKIIATITESGFSRIPVFNESFDHIRGVLHAKDLLPYIRKERDFRWQSLIRPTFYVPETKKIDDLLREFQKKKIHMAVVVDEYGGTSGIITLEDILEEIVGDISDEFDVVDKSYTRINQSKYFFDAKVLLNDFCKIVGCNDQVFDQVKGDADTLAGLILEIKGDMPHKHDILIIDHFKFSIEAVDNRRIKQVLVEILPDREK